MPVADPDPTWSDWFANLFKSQPASGAQPQPAGLSLNGMVPATPGVMAGPQPVLSDFQPPAPPQPQQQGGYWLPALAKGALASVQSGLSLPGDVATGKISPADPRFTGRVADMAGVATLGAGAAPAEADALNMGIRAYHASPYDFDRFDISKIGSGEGAQAYGHGLYFAENPDVADQYRQTFAAAATEKDLMGPGALAQGVLESPAIGGDRAKAIAELQNRLSQGAKDPGVQPAIDLLKDPQWDPLRSGAHGYEVDINAEPHQFLDWDKPLSEQSPVVQQAFKGAGVPSSATGQQAHQALVKNFVLRNVGAGNLDYGLDEGGADAAGLLTSRGLPGIKYLDQGSRAYGTPASVSQEADGGWKVASKDPSGVTTNMRFGTEDEARQFAAKTAQPQHNYVTFTDSIVNIMRKFGIGALGASAGGAMMLHPGQSRQPGA